MIKIDFHIHTSRYSACSSVNASQLVIAAEKRGIDVLILTEHDCFWDKSELEAIQHLSPKVTVLNGVEISARKCHVLAYGLPEDYHFKEGLSAEELFKDLSAFKDAALIPAHPYRFGKALGDLIKPYSYDALEGFSLNTTEEASCGAEGLSEKKKLPLLAASDLHFLGDFGKYWSETEEKIEKMEDFVYALKEKKVTLPSFLQKKIKERKTSAKE